MAVTTAKPASDAAGVMLGLGGKPDPVLAAVALLNVPPGMDRDDLIQDCRVRVIEALPDADPDKGLSSFSYNIARRHGLNLIRDHKRRAAHRKAMPRQVAGRESPTDGSAFAALAELPDADREIFELYAVEGRRPDDIAYRLGLDAEEVKLAIIRSRNALKAALSA